MNRNVESPFSYNPTNVDMQRSTFQRNSQVKFSFNVGDLIPFYVDEVLPGDTFNIRTSKVVRLQTLITPIMDNLYLDTYYFYVPNRLLWEHWREFNGENTASAWIPSVEYSIPQLTSPASTGWNVGTIADYMGIPTGITDLSVNALPFRAYALICNEWFRDQNLTDPLVIPLSDSTVAGTNGTNYISDTAKGGAPFKVAKYHDYFTSCLPAPQRGPDVQLQVADLELPVVPKDKWIDVSDVGHGLGFYRGIAANPPVYSSSDKYYAYAPDNFDFGIMNQYPTIYSGTYNLTPGNLWVDTQGASIGIATINELRTAFQIQRLYEKDARGGTRYIEILKSHFGVTSPDYRLFRPEYLGGNRVPITINQVLQQSGTVAGATPQGTPTGQSLTTDFNRDFVKSFTEHGYIIGVCCARYDHTYQQGLERFWSRKTRFDFYWPVLANIGEQAVLNKEIYSQGSSVKDSDGKVVDDKAFGYQEAWADYRYKPNRVAGEMRSSYTTSLDSWHLADDYSSLPTLSDGWIREDKDTVDRVLAIQSSVSNQLFCDVYVENKTTRPMPMYSIPGLIDHH